MCTFLTSMARIPKSQLMQVQNLAKAPFSTHALGVNSWGETRVGGFWGGEQGDVETLVEWNIHMKLAPQKDIKNP